MKPNISSISLQDIKLLNFEHIPGWEAQKEMSPPFREDLMQKINIENARVAAVLILLYEENNTIKFPVILRNTYKGVHSNQIGFPGGKVEKQDDSFAQTAMRETQEEIGANPNNIQILGALTQLYIPPSNFMVHPFVGIYNKKPDFSPCDFEVKEIIQIDLAKFLNSTNTTTLQIKKGEKYVDVPAFELENGMKIWGATAMMLQEFYVFMRKMLNL